MLNLYIETLGNASLETANTLQKTRQVKSI